jgi:AcrR family transcriptional regulator
MTSPILASLGDKHSPTTGKGLQRAQDILTAARDILVAEGYAGLTLRGVAARIDARLSNVQHYYRSKDALIEALLVYLMDDFQKQIETLLTSMRDRTQHERLVAVLDLLISEGSKSNPCGIFVEAWSLAQRLPFAAGLMEQIQERERKEFYRLMFGLNPLISAKECRRRAELSVLLIHGLMAQSPADERSSLRRSQLEDSIRRQILAWATVP